MEREARSQRELQALQAANNKAAKHQESVLVKLCVLVKLRAPAQRLGGVSLGTPLARAGSTDRFKEKFSRTCLQNATPPKWLRNRSCPRLGTSWRSLGAVLASLGGLLALLGPLGRVLALSWRLSALSWRLLAVSWRSWGLLGVS